MKPKFIKIYKAKQNNLKDLELRIPFHRMITITGVSGSGKSSLALDTLYAEGQRRYVETFSPYARQFLERMPRPMVDRIENIPPAIAIEQSNPVKSSRSTLGTLTEINHFMKMLFYREAQVFCPECGRPIRVSTTEEVAMELLTRAQGEWIVITAPVKAKEDPALLREGLIQAGFFRVWTSRGVKDLSDLGPLPEFEVVIDRLYLDEKKSPRLSESLEKAFAVGKDEILVRRNRKAPLRFSHRCGCPYCGIAFKTPSPNLFSFNSPVGACPECKGFGRIIDIDWDLVIPNQQVSIKDGAVKVFEAPAAWEEKEDLLDFCRREGISIRRAWAKLSGKAKEMILFGKGDWYGVKGFFDWLETKRYKAHVRIFLSRFRAYLPCPECEGTRFKKEALAYRLGGLNIAQVSRLSLAEAFSFFEDLDSQRFDPASRLLCEEIQRRISYLCRVGLDYLTLDRQSRTLSGGEVSRAMLTRALASSLVETLYILDEPSRGLHARDSSRVVDIVKRLTAQRNTVCVVEHDPEIIMASDFTVDLGPGPGERGGQVLYAGKTKGLLKLATPTAEAISGAGSQDPATLSKRQKFEHFLEIKGVRENNLKGIRARIPKGTLTVITGVSGSGKSTLLELVLYRGAKREKGLPSERAGDYQEMLGLDDIGEVVLVNQNPIGRTPRSNPASYLRLYDQIRGILAGTPDSLSRHLTPSTFSFNVKGGRCEVCKGQGFERVEMQFLSDVFLPCPACLGRRFRPEVLEIRYRGKNIHEILEMTLSESLAFFEDHHRLKEKLIGPIEIGLGYLRLGQPIQTLSGGEAQRMKLAHYLFTRPKSRALILIDEPTVGLHLRDVVQLNRALKALKSMGNTVVVVEHHFEVLKQADWVIDLGPEGGEAGGHVVYQGPLDGLLATRGSVTGRWFKAYLEGKGPKKRPARIQDAEPAPDGIKIIRARHHNLKDISLEIPRNQLVAVTGLSGSGKSTLAFDIVFAEGQRRYVESLSTYVRQFIRMYERPEVDLILGLPPTVAIEQRTSRAGPRSTVATLTEIYHYLRLLYAKVADPYCPSCGRGLSTRSVEEMVADLSEQFRGQRVVFLAPKVRRRKGFHRPLLESAAKKGYQAARIDGKMKSLHPVPRLSRYHEHTIELVVGQTEIPARSAGGLEAELERALQEGNQEAVVLGEGKEIFLSRKYYCTACGGGIPAPDPMLFSFNSPAGACPQCEGLGRVGPERCPGCRGTRLKKESLSYRVSGRDIGELCSGSVMEAIEFLQGLRLNTTLTPIADPILKETLTRLRFLRDLGLGYLTLNRAGDTLSGGEAQRIRLSSELGSNLVGVCYILDEPTIGLHPRDNDLLLKALKKVKERGNTVIVVEHDEETLRAADWIIDLGPEGGEKGGRILFQGRPEDLLSAEGSYTALLLKQEERYRITSRRRAQDCSRWLRIEGACARNLKHLGARIPLGTLVCVTGVSGSGKSTFLMDVLYPNLLARLKGRKAALRDCTSLQGTEYVKKVLVVDHSPVGRTPRSTPATYIGIMNEIRKLMATLPQSRIKGWKPGRFSFNVAGGRCEDCGGRGILKVEMKFLPEVYIVCETCGGKRYNEETLSVQYRGKPVSEILKMTFSEAAEFFSTVPSLKRGLSPVCDLGLGYLSLGQPSPTLSGGEAQRIKLAEEFIKSSSGQTLYFLDEPTTGLHLADIRKLLDLFSRLVERGDTVVVIEHNLEVIKEADWIIDLGPEGGDEGGSLLYQGPPEGLLGVTGSHTGRSLARYLQRVTPPALAQARSS